MHTVRDELPLWLLSYCCRARLGSRFKTEALDPVLWKDDRICVAWMEASWQGNRRFGAVDGVIEAILMQNGKNGNGASTILSVRNGRTYASKQGVIVDCLSSV
jgi:hypothetical protein